VRAVQHALGGNEPSALRSAVGDVLASQPASVRTDEDVRESFESFEALLELRIREPWREELELLVDEHREAFARAIVRARRAPRRSRS
jgi:formiminotetrahydrofolate cyclodeaminase